MGSGIVIAPVALISIFLASIFLKSLLKGSNTRYTKISIKPGASVASDIKGEEGRFVDRMVFFLLSLKSAGLSDGCPITLDITNKDMSTTYAIFVPSERHKGIAGALSSVFPDFEVTATDIDEPLYFSKYRGFSIFRSKQSAPYIQEEKDRMKIRQNIMSIIGGVKNGSLQIMCDFSKAGSVNKEQNIDLLKVDERNQYRDVGFIKDIYVSFRFLSYTKIFHERQIISLVGGVLNLTGKLESVTKMLNGGEWTSSPINLKSAIIDFVYSIFLGTSLRFGKFSPADGMYFSAREVAGIYNFVPDDKTERSQYQTFSPFDAIRTQRQLIKRKGEEEFTKVASYEYPLLEEKEYFRLDLETKRKHVYVIGKTGTGKTTFLTPLIKSDIESGKGFALIDPHGDLADKILDFIPEERKEDVVYIDPSDPDGMVNLGVFPLIREVRNYVSMMRENKFGEKDRTKTSSLVEMSDDILTSLFVESIRSVSVGGAGMWGPRMDMIMKKIVVTLFRYEMLQVTDISAFLNNDQFRAAVISDMDDPIIRDMFRKIQSEDSAEEWYQPIRNRIDSLLSKSIKEMIVGEPKISLRDCMDTGKILIFRIPKGFLSATGIGIVGGLIISILWKLAQAREGIPEHERKDFAVYIDEVQNFVTDDFCEILEEARKYRLTLIMANQFMQQIKDKNPKVYNTIRGNAHTVAAFNVGPDDAKDLHQFFGVSYNDLVGLPALHAIVKCPDYSSTRFNIAAEFVEKDPTKKYPGKDVIKSISASKYMVDIVKNENGEVSRKPVYSIVDYFNKTKKLPPKEMTSEKFRAEFIDKGSKASKLEKQSAGEDIQSSFDSQEVLNTSNEATYSEINMKSLGEEIDGPILSEGENEFPDDLLSNVDFLNDLEPVELSDRDLQPKAQDYVLASSSVAGAEAETAQRLIDLFDSALYGDYLDLRFKNGYGKKMNIQPSGMVRYNIDEEDIEKSFDDLAWHLGFDDYEDMTKIIQNPDTAIKGSTKIAKSHMGRGIILALNR